MILAEIKDQFDSFSETWCEEPHVPSWLSSTSPLPSWASTAVGCRQRPTPRKSGGAGSKI